MNSCAPHYRELIDTILTSDEPPQNFTELHQHIQECESCQRRYNRIVLAERLLHGGVDGLSKLAPSAIDRICANVLPPEPSLWRRVQHRLARTTPGRAYAAAGVLVVAALALIPLIRDGRRVSTEPSEFQSRGASATATRGSGFRAFCIEGAEVRPLVGESPTCSQKSLLKFTVSSATTTENLFLFGVDEAYRIKWYAPVPPGEESMPLAAGADQELGGAIRLQVNHGVGRVRVFGLFSPTPVTRAAVTAAVETLARGRIPVAQAVLPLPLPGGHLETQLIDITP